MPLSTVCDGTRFSHSESVGLGRVYVSLFMNSDQTSPEKLNHLTREFEPFSAVLEPVPRVRSSQDQTGGFSTDALHHLEGVPFISWSRPCTDILRSQSSLRWRPDISSVSAAAARAGNTNGGCPERKSWNASTDSPTTGVCKKEKTLREPGHFEEKGWRMQLLPTIE